MISSLSKAGQGESGERAGGAPVLPRPAGAAYLGGMKSEFHPCTFAAPSVWLRLVWENGGIPVRYWRKFAGILGLSALATPLRLAEWAAFSRKIARTRVGAPPLFVLGFARSGTTHLQNLFAADPQWGRFTTFQGVVAPFSFVASGRLKRLMAKGMEAAGDQTRPMDNVKITLDTPQEEDLAVAAVSRMSFVHQLSFPGRSRELLSKYVLMGAGPDGSPDGSLSPRELRRWDRVYVREVRKVALHSGGRPVMLRNTPNVGRTDHLARLFPGAKFVHIVRDPYALYPSLMHLYRTLLPLYQLDDYDWDEMEEFLVGAYRLVMRKYLRDRERIPKESLAEVRYEDLVRDPLGQLGRLYDELELPGWKAAREPVAAYLETLAGYRKNRFALPRTAISRIGEAWGFAADAWNYAPPPPPPPPPPARATDGAGPC